MVSAGVTVALLGTAAFFGASASSHEGDANRLIGYRNPPPEYASVAGAYTSALNDGHNDAHNARIALIAAAATGAVSITFFILDGVLTPASAPVAVVGPAPGGMAAIGRLVMAILIRPRKRLLAVLALAFGAGARGRRLLQPEPARLRLLVRRRGPLPDRLHLRRRQVLPQGRGDRNLPAGRRRDRRRRAARCGPRQLSRTPAGDV